MFPRNANRTIGSSNRGIGFVAQFLIIGVSCLTYCGAANASIVYINPDGPERFNWAGDGSAQSWLDITRPWDEQPGSVGGSTSISQDSFLSFGQVFGGTHSGIAIHVNAIEGLPFAAPVEAVPFSQGEPDQFTWNHAGVTYLDDLGSLLPEGETMYLGLRFELANATHYGWIGVVRTGTSLDALGWGYSTAPGHIPFAPVTPEPGTLSFVTIVAMVVFKRRTGLR